MTPLATFTRPSSLAATLEAVTQPDSCAFAGGAMLLGKIDLPFTNVVDLRGIPELQKIEQGENGLSLGSAVYLQEVVESDLVPPAVKRSLTRSIPLNLRNHTSVGETLLLQQPPAEWMTILAALQAHVESAILRDRTSIPLAAYLDDPQRREKRAIVTHIHLPDLPAQTLVGAAFVARTPADEAIVNTTAVVSLDSGVVSRASVVIAGASQAPVLPVALPSIIGQPLDEANIASAVKWVATAVRPVSDYLGSAEYRREMAVVTARRALLDCLNQT